MILKIVLWVAGAVAVLIAGFAIVVAMQPGEFRVTRSAKMKASPAAVFEQVNSFQKWDAWSPWAKLDPNAKVEFSGPTAGEGAKFAWSGNDKVGAGQQEIVESKPDELIRIRLEFERPMTATNTVELTFKPQADETVVAWTMFGPNNFMGKAFGLFVDCDKLVGADFEKGLENLKAIVEAPPAEQKEDVTTASES
jgi:hypothetical protein